MQLFSEDLHYVVKSHYWDLMHWVKTPRSVLRKEREERKARDARNKQIGKLLEKTFAGTRGWF